MPKKPVVVLRQFFQTGDMPTQQQFWDWMDSYFHKDDGIAYNNIEGLTEILELKADKAYIDAIAAGFFPKKYVLNGEGSIELPPSTLVEIIDVEMPEAGSMWIETVPGQQDIMTYDDELPFTERTINPMLKCKEATTLFFGGGFPADTQILIYLKSLIPQA
jgi:hypothetical protein